MTRLGERYRAPASLLVFLGWILITAFLPRLWEGTHVNEALDLSVATRFSFSIAAAIAFLAVVIALFRWNDLGLTVMPSPRALGLLWFPALYIGMFVGLALFQGLPPAANTLIILVNTIMVGVSEELACRGVLYAGLRSRLSLRASIFGSTALFGAVHVLNGFNTGDFTSAAIQAITAFMTGMVFMAIRLRTGSLIPGIALHAAWDFTAVSSAAGSALRHGDMASPFDAGWQMAIPVLVILPNFLYGLYLLRSSKLLKDEPAS